MDCQQSYTLSILRGEIFANYIHPSAEWWAWSDVDTVIGRSAISIGSCTWARGTSTDPRHLTLIALNVNVSGAVSLTLIRNHADVFAWLCSTVPWDIANRYDVIIPTHRNSDPERLVFMR